MASFKYELRETSGRISSGVIDAQSVEDATAALRDQGGFVLNVAPAGTAQNILDALHSVNIQSGPGLKDVYNFTNQLGVMIKAGINIRAALGGVADQLENLKFQKIVNQIKDDVESGQPFSEALEKHPKVFGPLYVNMVRASEMSGSFGHMLERIADYLDQQIETRRMVRGAMIYPAIIAVMAVVTTVFLLTFVLPQFTKLFASKEALLPTPTLALMALSDFMRNYWYVLLIGVAALGVGFFQAIRTRVGREYWDRAKLQIPLFRRMLRALYITRGLHTMGELISAGVPMLETLDITADVSGNVVYRRMWTRVRDAVEQGNKIAEPLWRQNLLPTNVVQMIAAGEESGNLGDVLQDISEFYGKELKSTIKSVTAMIEPLMIVLMGALVGFIAMSIILPIFKLSSLVKE
ncbi:MAG: type II secretion system F family protein [Phycisphaerae bacterium]|nr:type II secretion system F family protein [Phycisphaerae bacterium]